MSIRKEVFYHNAKALLGKPAKRVWFRLNPLLEKTSLFVLKKQDNSQFTLPLQSVVICERILEDETAFQATCTEADFWDYLFSKTWKGWSTVRVFEGQLMEWLLEALHALEETKAIMTQKTSVFTQNIRHIKRPLKGSTAVREIKETLKISFTYFGQRKGKLHRVFDSCGDSSDSMSLPDIEECLLSDDELFDFDSTAAENGGQLQSDDGQLQRPPTRRAISLASKSDTEFGARGGSFSSISEYEGDNEEDEFDIVTPSRVVKNLRGPHVSYKQWIQNREKMRCVASGPHPPSIYTVPHFHCHRPNRSQAYDSSITTKRDDRSEDSLTENSTAWLSQTMETMSRISGRTVDRLHKRLEELVEERNRNKKKAKPAKGIHLAEANRLAETYAHRPVTTPVLNRCHEVPSFEQYAVSLMKERGIELRYRGNRRRMQRRFKTQTDVDEPDFIVEESIDWRSPTSSAQKNPKGKKVKPSAKKTNKPPKRPVKTKPGAKQRPQTIKEVDEGSTPDRQNIVEVIVGITDCPAFRNNLSMISEYTDDTPVTSPDSPTRDQQVSTTSGEESSITDTRSSVTLTSRGTSTEPTSNNSPELRPGSTSASPPKSPTTVGSPDKSGANSPASQGTRSKEGSPDERSREGSPGNITPVDREDAETCLGPVEGLTNLEEHVSTVPGAPDTPVLFDARKINRKYSFEKLKAKRTYQKKRGFRDILKKFTRIQKIAAAFRKGAMTKAKKGKQKKTFTNPLCMSPSPEPEENFIGRITERRHALLPQDVNTPSFRYPTAAEFRSQLLVALDEFVVRKEQVVSNFHNRSLTSITFTRPDVFTRSEFTNQ